MSSEGWLSRRRSWRQAWVDTHGTEPHCAACGGPWSLRDGDLHHRSYDRLGSEADWDLVPLDRACHHRLHAILESSPAWRRLGRAQASDQIVARLRLRSAARELHDDMGPSNAIELSHDPHRGDRA